MIARASCEMLPLANNSVDLLFTDPPYPTEYLPCYGWLASESMRVLKPGGWLIAMCGGTNLNKIYRMFDDAGLIYFYEMQQKASGSAPVVWRHYKGLDAYPIIARSKPLLVYSKGASKPHISSVINLFETGTGWSLAKSFHHWGQDVNTCRYYIEYFSRKGDLVLDPFVGGGTTMIASELIDRRCIGFDIDPIALETTKNRICKTEFPKALLLKMVTP